jgi:hypothetical protein
VLAGTAWFENTESPLGVRTGSDIALADFDGDGDLDAFVACYNAAPVPRTECSENVVWLNDGQGNFTPSWHEQTSAVLDIGVGDLDGDEDLDVFLAKGGFQDSIADEVLLNDGHGNFANTGQQLGEDPSWGVALGDVDKDGDLDALVTRAGSVSGGPLPDSRVSVWLNDGHGNFSDSGQELGQGDAWAIALGDLDGDGDLDAYVGQGSRSRRDAVLINDGQGHFTSADQALGIGWAMGVELEDLDGDDDLDVFVANGDMWGGRQPNDVWLNDGAGNFTRCEQVWESSESDSMALGDVDGDGDLDAYVGNLTQDKLWLNDGSAHFTDSGQEVSGPRESVSVALGDIDGDGDLDIIVAKLGRANEIWLNVRPSAPLVGDANQDGRFDQHDVVQVLQADKYGAGQPAGWGEGDWTGDGTFDQMDIVAALQTGAYLAEMPPVLQVMSEYSGVETYVEGISDGQQWFSEDGMMHVRGRQSRYFEDVTDPRLRGEAIVTTYGDATLVDPPVSYHGSMWGEMRVENEDGDWVGTWVGRRTTEGYSYIWVFLEGDGAYTGLRAHATYTRETLDSEVPLQIAGVVLATEAPDA